MRTGTTDVLLECEKRALMWDEKKRGGENKAHERANLILARESVMDNVPRVSDPICWKANDAGSWFSVEVAVPFGNEPRCVLFKTAYKIINDGNDIVVLLFGINDGSLMGRPVLALTRSFFAACGLEVAVEKDVHQFVQRWPLYLCSKCSIEDAIKVKMAYNLSCDGELSAEGYYILSSPISSKGNKQKYLSLFSSLLVGRMKQGDVIGRVISNVLTLKEAVERYYRNKGYRKNEAVCMSMLTANIVNVADIIGVSGVLSNVLRRAGDAKSEDNIKMCECLERDVLYKKASSTPTIKVWTQPMVLSVVIDYIQGVADVGEDEIALAFILMLAAMSDEKLTLQSLRMQHGKISRNRKAYKSVWAEVDKMLIAAGKEEYGKYSLAL